ncbi:hypothetical protein ACHAW6_009658 [Cyclotella cf. meneghiniana]
MRKKLKAKRLYGLHFSNTYSKRTQAQGRRNCRIFPKPRGRTIFSSSHENRPKRVELLFVIIDKEIKSGDIFKARALFDSVVNPVSNPKRIFKFSDEQMKSMFKKRYRTEDKCGDGKGQGSVKDDTREERQILNLR